MRHERKKGKLRRINAGDKIAIALSCAPAAESVGMRNLRTYKSLEVEEHKCRIHRF